MDRLYRLVSGERRCVPGTAADGAQYAGWPQGHGGGSQAYASVRADDSLQHVVDEKILSRGQRCFIVERDHKAVGLLTLQMIKDVPRNEWETTMAAQAMLPMSEVKRVQPDSELWDALEEMDRDGVNQLPVMADGRLYGNVEPRQLDRLSTRPSRAWLKCLNKDQKDFQEST